MEAPRPWGLHCCPSLASLIGESRTLRGWIFEEKRDTMTQDQRVEEHSSLCADNLSYSRSSEAYRVQR